MIVDKELRHQIVAAFRKRRNAAQTAAEFNLPRLQVTQVLLEEGVAQRRHPQRARSDLTMADRRRVVDAYREAGSVERAGEAVGLPTKTVREVLGKMGIPVKRRRPTMTREETVAGAKNVDKANPIVASVYYLSTRRRWDGLAPRLVTRQGIEYLDGVPVTSMLQRMKATNEEMKRLGEEQIGYCREWLV